MSASQNWRLEPTVCPPTVDRRIGQYDLIEPLGRGGMGVVWKAVHRHLGQTVALKFLSSDSWTDPRMVARFYREMRAVGSVAHPNLVHALDAGEYDGHHVLVMEYVPGVTLRDLLNRAGPLPVPAACEIARQAALGLSAIAAADMVHRDIKPSNLILRADGTLKILDLGLARFHVDVDDRDLTASGNLLGTVDYMSPEQSQDPRSVDARSDLYSLGCTLYALLTGATPFALSPGASMEARLRAHREAAPVKVESLREDIPPELSQVIDVLLAKRPEDRSTTADELVDVLGPLSSSEILVEHLKEHCSSEGMIVNFNAPSNKDGTTQPKGASRFDTSVAPTSRSRPLSNATSRYLLIISLSSAFLVGAWIVSQSPWRMSSNRSLAGTEQGDLGADLKSPENTVPTVPVEATVELPDFTRAPRLEWHALLERRPTPVVWQNEEGLAHWDWQEKQDQLLISNNERGLLSLGKLDAPSFMLQFGMHQNRWPGGVGVFLGMRNWDVQHTSPGWNCYQFMIQDVSSLNGPRRNRIDFLRLDTDPGTERETVFLPVTLASENVSGLVGEAILDITIKNGRLNRVMFNGVLLQDLMEEVNEVSPPIDWSGGLGICTNGGDLTIRTARLMVLESDP